jgi:Mor family transcriptional regulator
MNSGPNPRSNAPEFLLDLVHHSADVLREAGLPPESIKEIAINIAMRQAEQWGGEQIYFPKGTWNGRGPLCLKLEERNWKIYHEYDGTNREDVRARHGISLPRFYQIITAIHRQRAREPLPPAPKNAVTSS